MALVLRPCERTVEAGQRREDTKEAHGPSSHKPLRLVIVDGVHQPEQVAHDENDAKGKVGGAKPALVEETTARETRAEAVTANVGKEALPAGQGLGSQISVVVLLDVAGCCVKEVGVGGSDVGGQELDVLLGKPVKCRAIVLVEDVLVVPSKRHEILATRVGCTEVVDADILFVVFVVNIGKVCLIAVIGANVPRVDTRGTFGDDSITLRVGYPIKVVVVHGDGSGGAILVSVIPEKWESER
jgi:hypothetical protein